MKSSKLLAVLVGLACATVTGADAQSLRRDQGPKEFPPADYQGRQYVDSAGCAYIRAGIDGIVTWVPRVARDRKVLCGFKPTLSADARAAAPTAAPQTTPTQITLAPPAPPAAARSAPKAVAPVAVPTAATARRPACAGASPISGAYINSGERGPVRCGPQSGRIATNTTAVSSQPTAAPNRVSAQTRVVPRHVWENRQNTQNVQVPKGYRTVWEDDRLNPRRAEQTLQGIAQTRLIWTDTLPRRLVDTTTGQDVTARVALVYPYTDATTQRRELGEVKLLLRDGQVVKRVNRSAATTPVISSRNAPDPKTGPARYVQIATFADKTNAMTTARKFQAMGMPLRIRSRAGLGRTTQTVLAGPFTTDASVQTALANVRNAGFRDAFVRR